MVTTSYAIWVSKNSKDNGFTVWASPAPNYSIPQTLEEGITKVKEFVANDDFLPGTGTWLCGFESEREMILGQMSADGVISWNNPEWEKRVIVEQDSIPDADRNDYILEGMTEEDIWGDSLTTTTDCTVKLFDVQSLLNLISQKILGDAVVSNYLCQVWECFSINAKNELQIEWSIKDYLDEKGKECCELGYISVPILLKELEEKDFIPVCKRLVENCERVFYNAYHEQSSDAFPLEFMADKIKRL